MSDAPDLSLKETAIALHESYTSFVEAGFTEKQALQIVIGIFTGGNRTQ